MPGRLLHLERHLFSRLPLAPRTLLAFLLGDAHRLCRGRLGGGAYGWGRDAVDLFRRNRGFGKSRGAARRANATTGIRKIAAASTGRAPLVSDRRSYGGSTRRRACTSHPGLGDGGRGCQGCRRPFYRGRSGRGSARASAFQSRRAPLRQRGCSTRRDRSPNQKAAAGGRGCNCI